jgi:hypothetical protein
VIYITLPVVYKYLKKYIVSSYSRIFHHITVEDVKRNKREQNVLAKIKEFKEEEIIEPVKHVDWRSELKESDWTNTTTGNKVASTFTHSGSGDTFTHSAIGGVIPSTTEVGGETVSAPTESQYDVLGYAPLMQWEMQRKKSKKSTGKINQQLDSGSEVQRKNQTDIFDKARLEMEKARRRDRGENFERPDPISKSDVLGMMAKGTPGSTVELTNGEVVDNYYPTHLTASGHDPDTKAGQAGIDAINAAKLEVMDKYSKVLHKAYMACMASQNCKWTEAEKPIHAAYGPILDMFDDLLLISPVDPPDWALADSSTLPPGRKWEKQSEVRGGIVDGQWDPNYIVSPEGRTQADVEKSEDAVGTPDDDLLDELAKKLGVGSAKNFVDHYIDNFIKGDGKQNENLTNLLSNKDKNWLKNNLEAESAINNPKRFDNPEKAFKNLMQRAPRGIRNSIGNNAKLDLDYYKKTGDYKIDKTYIFTSMSDLEYRGIDDIRTFGGYGPSLTKPIIDAPKNYAIVKMLGNVSPMINNPMRFHIIIQGPKKRKVDESKTFSGIKRVVREGTKKVVA